MKRILFIFFILFLPLVSNAATYSVCSSGCDETTIQAVFDNNDLAPADIVEVHAGTYAEMVTWGSNDSGDSGNDVTLRAKSGETVTIDGDRTRANCVYTNDQDYLTIDGINCKEAADVGFRIATQSDNVTVQNLSVYDVGESPCSSTGSEEMGFAVRGDNVTIDNVTIYNICDDGIGHSDGDNFTVSNSTIYDFDLQESVGDGIQLLLNGVGGGNTVADYSINNNTFTFGSSGPKGFIVNGSGGGTANGVIESNTFNGANLANWGVSNFDDGLTIRYNWFQDMNGPCYRIAGANQKFYSNVCIDSAQGVYARAAETGSVVYNNTFSNITDRAIDANDPTNVISFEFKNNIVTLDTNDDYIVGGANATITADYNNIYPESTSFITYQGSTYNTLAAFFSGEGMDENSDNGDPLFSDSSNDNFTLQDSSPGKDAGVDLGATYQIDYVGTSRPKGAAWDIGAYEFIGATQSGIIRSGVIQ